MGKKSSKRDLILLKEQTNAMNRDLSGKLAKAISMGMAKAKKAEATALSNIKKSKKALSTFSASVIERMANGVYKTIQGGRHSKVKVKKSEGVGAGAKTLPAIFGGKKMKMKNAVSSINFLVNEYTRTLT